MNDGVVAVALLALGGLLIASVVVILLHVKRKAQENEELAELAKATTVAPKAAPKAKSNRKNGLLVINNRRFEFSFKREEEDDVGRLMGLIKHSLSLLKETKYKDIIASRAKECETLIKQLDKLTDLDKMAMQEILDCFKEYANGLKAAA
ncbi:hypothetical protein AGMMS50229_02340 [Campylobacterota bacterium]|nr:hypothetical protein AGMMS50229_02340 [Campylobacterota bacterium]